MPRPTNKADLVTAAQNGYDKLITFIDALPTHQLEAEFAFEDRDRNLRDVLAHLVEWHHMMQRWYGEGMANTQPKIPAEGYTWQTLPALNRRIWEQAQAISLDEARANLATTHEAMMGLITAHSDEELFTKKRYKWTGTTSLAAYLISSTSSHYDWALTKLKKAVKSWKTNL